jgi:1,4-alpha-glucan branching enzyme
VNALSHDEVVHMKGSLLNKMPGDFASKLANLRLLLAYMWTRPGGELLFMGSELAPWSEWTEQRGLEWHLTDAPGHRGVGRHLEDLGRLRRGHPCLWRGDQVENGFTWIDCSDRKNSVLAYQRRAGEEHVVVVLNLTPVAHETYRIGAPAAGVYRLALDTSSEWYDGWGGGLDPELATDPEPMHGQPQSLRLRLPGLSALVYVPV